MKYAVYIRINHETKVAETDDYILAWAIYGFFVKKMPATACIDILDCETGEVFQSNQLDL